MSDARRVRYNSSDHVLVCGSSGAIALVEVTTKKLVYFNTDKSKMNSPHAVALLPDSIVATADPADSKGIGGGASVKLYDMSQGNDQSPIQSEEIAGCHGIVWDSQRSMVWAWGGALHQFAYKGRRLTKLGTFRPPASWNAGGGHALAPMGSSRLLFSYNGGFGVFDIGSSNFSKYALKGAKGVTGATKGLSYHPETGEIISCHEDPATGDYRPSCTLTHLHTG